VPAKPDVTDAVLLLGAGRMGSALLRGWVATGRLQQIYVVEPNPSEAVKALAGAGSITLSSESDFTHFPRVQTAVIAMKPQAIRAETALLQQLGTVTPLVLSIAAGITTSFLAAQLGRKTRVIRAMPNTPGSIGQGITVLHAGRDVEAPDRALAESLMSAFGETLWLDEEALLDVVTALSGSGPAYVFLLAEALAAAGREQGLDSAVADKLARFTVSGAGALIAADSRPAAELRRDVTSPGGTTEAALNVLTAPDGLPDLIARAVDAATERGKALGRHG
jgi:pyrroline-5-carboxylate reductase